MAALTEGRNTPRRRVTAINRTVSNGVSVWAGGLAALLTADATAVPAGTANSGDAVGVFQDSVVGDGVLTVDMEAGCYRFNNSAGADLIGAVNVGAECYIVDDQTVALTDNAGARKKAGVIADVDANGVWVVVGNPTP